MKLSATYLFILLFSFAACNSNNTAEKLDPLSFKQSLEQSNNALVLDVRTGEEFEMEHIKGATNLNIYDDHFESSLEALDKNSPIFVYCKSGNRSNDAKNILQKAGFKEVYELEGGLQNWKANNLSVESKNIKPQAPVYSLERYNQIIDSNHLVLVDFMAEWCGPCLKMGPHIEKIKEQYPENLKVLKIDTDKNHELSRHFKISSIPAIKIYLDGKLIENLIGYQTEEQLLGFLEPHL